MVLKTCKANNCHNLFVFGLEGRPKEFCNNKCSSRTWAKNNRKLNPEIIRAKDNIRKLKRYNMTPDKYNELLSAQNNGCAVCGTLIPGGQGRFHIDHNHNCCPKQTYSCGQCVRGLLCSNCNLALGLLQNDATRIANLVRYIEKNLI